MLGLTSYQEALRALGRLVGSASTELRLIEDGASRTVRMTVSEWSRELTDADIEEVIVMSMARRGERRPAGEVSDVLRSVGLALDELRARDVSLTLGPDRLHISFSSAEGTGAHELAYVGDELDALRRSAADRRNGQPLRRILILQAAPDSSARVAELLVAEFAVQALPTMYARAVAASAEPPDLVLAQVSTGTLDAFRMLRRGDRTAHVPVVALTSPECPTGTSELFIAGADDVLDEPFAPAQLRARVRTWLLRGRGGPYTVS
jgi:CheY-like chemotaxis protein